MELDYALLAEKASRLEDGRLVVFGGDIDGVEAEKLPVLFQTTFVAKLLLDKGENPQGHLVEIHCTGPSGERAVIMKSELLDAPDIDDDALRPGVGLIANLQIVFKAPGVYRFHLVADGKDMKTIPMHVHGKQAVKTEAKDDENVIAHSH